MFKLTSQKILDTIILLPLLWSFTGLFLYENGKKLLVVLVLLSIVSSIYSYGVKSIFHNIKSNKLIWVLGAYSIFSLFAKTYYGYSSSLARGLICLFLFITVFPPSLAKKINIKHLIILGTLTSFIFVMVQTFILGKGRMWDINPIPYATFITSLSVVSFYYLLQSKSLKQGGLWFVTFTAAVIPLLYSQSRGLWLALIIVIIALTIKTILNNKKLTYLLIPIMFTSGIAYYVSHDKISQRIHQTTIEVEQIMKGNLDTSIGLRLQMWKAALILSQESPLIGLGNTHKIYKEELAQQKIISPSVVKFTHYHNQFLSDLVKYGIVGLALLLLSIILPCYYLKKNNNEYTIPGLSIVAVFVIASLTDVPFQHAQTLTFYFLTIYLLSLKRVIV